MGCVCQIANRQTFNLCILHRGRCATVRLDQVAHAECTPVHHITVPLLHTAVEIVSRQTDDFGGHRLNALVLVLVLLAPSSGLLRIGYNYNKLDLCMVRPVFQNSLRRQRVKAGTSSGIKGRDAVVLVQMPDTRQQPFPQYGPLVLWDMPVSGEATTLGPVNR